MAQHVLIGSLLCNVLITWDTLQEPSMPTHGQPLSIPPPHNQNKWVHPVIFKPQPKIQSTQSSYKVTFFLDFQPFLESFQPVSQYLEHFKKDLNNPQYMQKLVFENIPMHLEVSWYSLEQYIGFVVRQAFNYCCSLHQV